mmetsp:Transcript_25759/g.57941  ORF Transcript_25759/g.57941 Transcript_25759/m.57941 type:complete len:240 (-) Transcript_25759:441-1160(-)
MPLSASSSGTLPCSPLSRIICSSSIPRGLWLQNSQSFLSTCSLTTFVRQPAMASPASLALLSSSFSDATYIPRRPLLPTARPPSSCVPSAPRNAGSSIATASRTDTRSRYCRIASRSLRTPACTSTSAARSQLMAEGFLLSLSLILANEVRPADSSRRIGSTALSLPASLLSRKIAASACTRKSLSRSCSSSSPASSSSTLCSCPQVMTGTNTEQFHRYRALDALVSCAARQGTQSMSR